MSDKKISPTLDVLKEFLEKARKRMSDEEPDLYEQADEDNYSPEDPLSDDDDDAANSWLSENDPEAKKEEPEPEPTPAQAPAAVPPSAPPKKAAAVGPSVRKLVPPAPVAAKAPIQTYREPSEDDLQPTREELVEMREYTRPWEQRARDRARLEAQPHVNPIKHHQGRIVEARNITHADRNKAYQEFINSPEYKAAEGTPEQYEMDAKFHEDWTKQNPDHIHNAVHTTHEAHKKGIAAREMFERAKDEKIRHIAGGGVQTGAYSVEEGLQHAGGERGEEGEAPSGIMQDPSASFASGNQEFLQDYMKNYDKRAKKFNSAADLDSFDDETRADIERVLGDHPALKNPAKKYKVDQFVARYHPLIHKAAKRVLGKMGLTEQGKTGQIDYGLMHEAGMHALFQAVNDYDHDHPSQAKFVTHLNRKMHGLMQTALKTQDSIPQELRTGAKKFDKQVRTTNAAPVKHTDKFGNTINPDGSVTAPSAAPPPTATPKPVAPAVVKRPSHEIAASHPPEVQDRLKRVAAAKQPLIRRGTGNTNPAPTTPKQRWNVNIAPTSTDEEE